MNSEIKEPEFVFAYAILNPHDSPSRRYIEELADRMYWTKVDDLSFAHAVRRDGRTFSFRSGRWELTSRVLPAT